MRKYVTLGDVCKKGSSNIAQKDIENSNGTYAIYGASGYIKDVNFYHQDKPYIAVVKDGAGIGRTMLLPEKTSVIGTLQYLIPNDSISVKYLYYAVTYMNLSKYFTGATIPHIYFKDYQKELLPLPPMEKQQEIAGNLEKIDTIIGLCNSIMERMDVLVKSRFVEMFGDPVSNPFEWEKVPLSELADIRIGPFGSLLHKDDYIDNGHPLVNPSHIKDGKIVTDCKLTISDEKFREMAAYHLKIGDVVMGRRGEMGRCAVVNEDGLLCGTGSLFIRSKGEITADYIQKIISFPSFKKIIEDMAVGQTMPNLNVPIVSNFKIIKPPIGVQHKYYSFVHQIDKSKLVCSHIVLYIEILLRKERIL
ncbi:MAG: restriction endonuclease subunit S [Schaedlerella sp.]|uniref:restriction endonuclease subunit S n=1 Tax=Schaedlerella sp. TaxID=2676057 RepID=UPI003527D1D6